MSNNIFKLIKTYSKHPFSVILIYYCSFTFIEFNFELMRETIAVAIFLMYGIKYYLSKKWIKYYLIVLLAYSFHPSAMMMFLLPLIRNLKWGVSPSNMLDSFTSSGNGSSDSIIAEIYIALGSQ